MGSLEVDSPFTNVPLEETINICCDTLFEETDIYGGYHIMKKFGFNHVPRK